MESDNGAGEGSVDTNESSTNAAGSVLDRVRLALAVAILRRKPPNLPADHFTRQLQLQVCSQQLADRKRSRQEIDSLKRRLLAQEVTTAQEMASAPILATSFAHGRAPQAAAGLPDAVDTSLLDACLTLTSSCEVGEPAHLRALHRVLDAVVLPETHRSSVAVATLLRLDGGRVGAAANAGWSWEVHDVVRTRFRNNVRRHLAECDCRSKKEEGVDVLLRLASGSRLRVCMLEALLDVLRQTALQLANSAGTAPLPPPSVWDNAGLLFSLIGQILQLRPMSDARSNRTEANATGNESQAGLTGSGSHIWQTGSQTSQTGSQAALTRNGSQAALAESGSQAALTGNGTDFAATGSTQDGGSITGSGIQMAPPKQLPAPVRAQYRELDELCEQRHLVACYPLFVYRLWHMRAFFSS